MTIGGCEVIMKKMWMAACALVVTASALAVGGADGESVVLKDPPSLSWGKDGVTTFCGALSKGLAMDGQTVSYEELMVDTGLAFRVRWFQGVEERKRVCPSSPVGEFPEETGLAGKAIGRSFKGVVRLDRKDPHMGDCLPQIMKELQAGRPVLGYDRALNVNLIYGYEADAKEVLTRDFFNGDKTVKIPLAKLPGHLIMLGGKSKAPIPEENAIRGIEHAVKNWTRDEAAKSNGKAFYAYGKQGYERWIKDLKESDTNDVLAQMMFQPNWWTFDSLTDARRAGGKHLRVLAKTSKAKEELLQAAAICDEIGKASASVYVKHDAFTGPWSGKKQDAWDNAMRQRELAILENTRDLDEKLIAQLALALEKMK